MKKKYVFLIIGIIVGMIAARGFRVAMLYYHDDIIAIMSNSKVQESENEYEN